MIYMGQSVLFCYPATMACGPTDGNALFTMEYFAMFAYMHIFCIYFISCAYILHKYRAYFFSFSYLEEHLCLFQTDNSLTRILFQTINHVLEGDHRDLHQHHEEDDDDNDDDNYDGDDDNDQSSP